MKYYKVFSHSDGSYEAVKQGFSWPAFFFSFIWALIKKIWPLAGIMFAVNIAISIVQNLVSPSVVTEANAGTALVISLVFLAIFIIVAIYWGKIGNKEREKNLLSRGYKEVTSLTAASPDQAIVDAKNKQ